MVYTTNVTIVADTTFLVPQSVAFKKSSQLFVLDHTQKLNFLIDTGSDLSLLSSSAIKNVPKRSDLILQATDASTITTYTYAFHSLALTFGTDKPYDWLFTIADVTSPIIGDDFLESYNLVPDLKYRKLIDRNTETCNTRVHATYNTAVNHLFSLISETNCIPGQNVYTPFFGRICSSRHQQTSSMRHHTLDPIRNSHNITPIHIKAYPPI